MSERLEATLTPFAGSPRRPSPTRPGCESVIGVGVITLRAYAMRLKHSIERERLLHGGRDDSELAETLVAMQDQMVRLNERLDFNERLLSTKESEQG